MKHEGYTPGPWEVLNNYVKKVGGAVIATTARNDALCNFEAEVASLEDAANTLLIADAPRLAEEVERLRAVNADLVESLKDVLARDLVITYDEDLITDEMRTKIKAAVAHAEGVNHE